MASRSLGTLTLDLIAKVSGFTAGMTEAERASDKAARKAKKDFEQMSAAAAKWGAIVGTAAAAAATAVVAMGARAVEAVAAQNDLAQTLGATQAELVGLTRAADLSGVSSDTLATAMKKLNAVIGDAQNGSKSAVEAFDKIGLSADKLAALPVGERFDLIARALTGVESQTLRASAAVDLFGKSGQALLPMLQDGGETLRIAAEQTQAWGLALSDLDVARIAQADDAMSNVRAMFSGLQNELAVEFAPLITALSEKLIDAGKEGKGFATVLYDGFRVVSTAAAFVLDLLHAMYGILQGIKVVTDGLAFAFNLTAMSVEEVALAIDRVLGTDTEENLKRRQEVITKTVSASMKRVAESAAEFGKTWDSELNVEKVGRFFAQVEKRAAETKGTIAGVLGGSTETGTTGDTGKPSKADQAMAAGIETVDLSTVLAENAAIMDEYRAQQLAADAFYSAQKHDLLTDDLMAEIGNAEEKESWLTEIKRKGAEERAAFEAMSSGQQVASVAGALQDMTAATANSNKKMFAIHKVASIASAIVNTAEAATKNLAKYPGPLGAAMAAAAVASGMLQIATIRAQQFGGGGGVSSGRKSSGVSQATVDTATGSVATAQQAEAAKPKPAVDIRLFGSARPSLAEVAAMMEEMGERLADSGGRLGKVTVVTT